MTEDKKVTSLIKGCRKHKEASQIKLYKHFYSYAMGVCLPYARNREAALEIVNDGFLKVFTKIEQYDVSKNFKPWLRKILVRAAIDYYRKYGERKLEVVQMTTSDDSTYNEALDQLAYDDLMLIIQQLSPAYRLVFNLYVVEGYSHAEVAEQLGISIGASKSNLSKARQKIKDLLKTNQANHVQSRKYG